MHRNVVRLRYFGIHSGGDLEQLIEAQNGKLMSEQIVLNILIQICFGLQEVHSKLFFVNPDELFIATLNLLISFSAKIKM